MMNTYLPHCHIALVLTFCCLFNFSYSQNESARVNSVSAITLMSGLPGLNMVNVDVEPLATIDSHNQVVLMSR